MCEGIMNQDDVIRLFARVVPFRFLEEPEKRELATAATVRSYEEPRRLEVYARQRTICCLISGPRVFTSSRHHSS